MVADVGPEDMDHDVPEVQENPLRSHGAFDAEWRNALAGEVGVNVVRDGPHLTLRFPGAQDQIIGD